ncbi:hypothetical protein C1645_783491 [Glomus cerebriforme]|uniref:Uncharacterized protein n=1 Tax=Glomus cerebriforme TaxID=658196 RepID=A0A397SJE4_9GLOM|nr:hypothetical protein C1645_783491 [Glomus cerebriforme]
MLILFVIFCYSYHKVCNFLLIISIITHGENGIDDVLSIICVLFSYNYDLFSLFSNSCS